MRKRRFKKAGIEAAELAFGAWAIGGLRYGAVHSEEAEAAIKAYLESGGNFIDTARMYDESEGRIGVVLKEMGNRDHVVIATKTVYGSQMSDIPNIRYDLEASLRQLKTEYIDIYQLHDPPEKPEVIDAALSEMEALKQEGKIRAIGASIKGPNVTETTAELCRAYIDTGKVDALQIIYSIFRQSNRQIFEQASEAGVGIIARTVLESGFLTGKYNGNSTFVEGDHRVRWSADQIERFHEEAQRIMGEHIKPPYETLAQLAIKFALAPPEVTTLILGARTAEQVNRNMAVAQIPDLNSDTLSELENKYEGFENVVNI